MVTKGKLENLGDVWQVLREHGLKDDYCPHCDQFLIAKVLLEQAENIKELVEAYKNFPEPKSILAEAAYTGGDLPKKWINDRGHYIDGYNQALKEVNKSIEQVLAKMEVKQK